jgi:hypothetical protein
MGDKILKHMINSCSHGHTEDDLLEDEEVANIDMVDTEPSTATGKEMTGGSGSHQRKSLSSMHGRR